MPPKKGKGGGGGGGKQDKGKGAKGKFDQTYPLKTLQCL